jgi:hypothetical protein
MKDGQASFTQDEVQNMSVEQIIAMAMQQRVKSKQKQLQ